MVRFDDLTVALEKNDDTDKIENGKDRKEYLSEAGESWCGNEIGDVGEEIGQPNSSGDRKPFWTLLPLPQCEGLTESEG